MTEISQIELSKACRILGRAGHDDFHLGHVSLRDPSGDGFWIKAAPWGFGETTPARVVLVDWDGKLLAGEGKVYGEHPIHGEILRARPDANAVVHTHASSSVAFAALGVPLRPISHHGCLFVPPKIARFESSGDLILTRADGQDVATALGDRNALLLVNHGIVTVGADLPVATVTAVLLEESCGMQLSAMRAGKLLRYSNAKEAVSKRSKIHSSAQMHEMWNYLVRQLDESEQAV